MAWRGHCNFCFVCLFVGWFEFRMRTGINNKTFEKSGVVEVCFYYTTIIFLQRIAWKYGAGSRKKFNFKRTLSLCETYCELYLRSMETDTTLFQISKIWRNITLALFALCGLSTRISTDILKWYINNHHYCLLYFLSILQCELLNKLLFNVRLGEKSTNLSQYQR